MSNSKPLGSLGLLAQYSDLESDSAAEEEMESQGKGTTEETFTNSVVSPASSTGNHIKLETNDNSNICCNKIASQMTSKCVPNPKFNPYEESAVIDVDPDSTSAILIEVDPTISAVTLTTEGFNVEAGVPTSAHSSDSSRLLSFADAKEIGIDKDDNDVIPVGVLLRGESYAQFRIKEEPISDTETVDSESDSSSSDSDDGSARVKGTRKKKKKKKSTKESSDSEWEDDDGKKKPTGPPKVKGEMSFDDLPPIQDLHISVPHEQARPIGVIKSVVEPLVVVEALPNCPALDIDSILFLDEGDRALGAIFDVLGQVKQPFYCVRFNSLEHIESRGVVTGMPVYCAPSTPHTSYVLLAQLQKAKGTDASWRDDIEPPPEVQEFSDDEAERMVKKNRRKKKANASFPTAAEATAMGLGPGPRPPPHYRPRFSRGIHRPQNSHYNNYYPPPPPPPPVSDVGWHNHPSLTHPYQNFPQVFSNNDSQNHYQHQQSSAMAYSNITARNCWPHPHGPFIGQPRWNPGQVWKNPNAYNHNSTIHHNSMSSVPPPPPPPPGC